MHVIGERTIAIPDRPGNKRVDGYLNVLERPQVGTLFLVPGRGDTLRINGRGRVMADADYFDVMTVQGKRPVLALEVDVAEVFFHCAKAFLRSGAWKPESWDPAALPSAAHIAQAMRQDWSMAQREEYYSDESLRKMLYRPRFPRARICTSLPGCRRADTRARANWGDVTEWSDVRT